MTKEKTTNLTATIIGGIGVITGLIPAFEGAPFDDYAFTLLISFTLMGVGLINLRSSKSGN